MLETHARRWPEGPSGGRRCEAYKRVLAWASLASLGCAGAAETAEYNGAALMQVSPAAGLLGWLMLVALLLVLVLVLAAAWRGVQRRNATQIDLLRQTRLEAQSLAALLDVWHWRTDRQHRLLWLRPPLGAEPSAWATCNTPCAVWDHFNADATAALQARFEAAAALTDVAVSFSAGAAADDTKGSRIGHLRAAPLLDAEGRFDGFLGTVREVPGGAAEPPGNPPAAAPESGYGETAAGANDSESFSYTVSHDLRAPIRVVEGFTKILKEDYGRVIDRIGNDHLDRVLGAAARMNSMIDALLALSQLSARPLSRQPVNLSQLAGYVADDLRRQSPQREVALHIEPGMLVHGDPTLLRVVLENLLGNAWKYTGKCREAQISFAREAREAANTFTVRDNGAGFDMRFADRLFGVFQRLHSANDFQGTGVGLASVRRIIRRHGGEIWAEAEVERGATFYFTLDDAKR